MEIAGSSSGGLLEFAWSGGDTKRWHLGRASQMGLESALLARQGVHGPATVLEGRYSYFNASSTPPRMERLLEGLGAEWAVDSGLRQWAEAKRRCRLTDQTPRGTGRWLRPYRKVAGAEGREHANALAGHLHGQRGRRKTVQPDPGASLRPSPILGR